MKLVCALRIEVMNQCVLNSLHFKIYVFNIFIRLMKFFLFKLLLLDINNKFQSIQIQVHSNSTRTARIYINDCVIKRLQCMVMTICMLEK